MTLDGWGTTCGQRAAVRHGNAVFTREFAHLSVWVDVERREARLDWREGPAPPWRSRAFL